MSAQRPAPALAFASVIPGGPPRINIVEDGVCRVWSLTDDQALLIAAIYINYLAGKPKV